MVEFSEWIERQANFTPGKVAIRFGDRVLTYAEFAAAVRWMSRALVNELGVGAGDRVAYLGYNSPEMIVLLFACARVGAILMLSMS